MGMASGPPQNCYFFCMQSLYISPPPPLSKILATPLHSYWSSDCKLLLISFFCSVHGCRDLFGFVSTVSHSTLVVKYLLKSSPSQVLGPQNLELFQYTKAPTCLHHYSCCKELVKHSEGRYYVAESCFSRLAEVNTHLDLLLWSVKHGA